MKFAINLILAVGLVASSVKSDLSTISSHANRTHTLIFNGLEATPHEIPSILNVGEHYCGATLIHPQWALTAAHCLEIDQLVAGDHIINKDEGTEQIVRVAQIFKHPKYQRPGRYSNDAALLKLERAFKLNEYVSVAKLPPRNFQPTGNMLVAGWGRNEYGYFPNELHKVTVPFVSNKACKRAYGRLVDNSMICAGSNGKGGCPGDSGGPLFCESPNGLVHCGIVSWGRNCGQRGYPTVFARTSHFLDWIKKTTGLKV